MSAQVQALRSALATRDRALNELENRLALLEAEQRQLRYAVAEAQAAPVGIRETVRIGRDAPGSAPERPAVGLARERSFPAIDRPILRLTGERRRDQSEPLPPIPVVNERLPVAPLPMSLPPDEAATQAAEHDASTHYRLALDLVRRRDFGAALGSLTDFLEKYPADARVPRVMFWRGEVLFAQQKYGLALEAFESSLARESTGGKASDALLKVSLCHKRLGAHDRAKIAIERLKSQFPQSDAARLAAQEDA